LDIVEKKTGYRERGKGQEGGGFLLAGEGPEGAGECAERRQLGAGG